MAVKWIRTLQRQGIAEYRANIGQGRRLLLVNFFDDGAQLRHPGGYIQRFETEAEARECAERLYSKEA